MDIHALIQVLKQVFTNPYVIITAAGVFLYMDFCIYVANYVKKPKKQKKKKNLTAKPVPAGSEEDKQDAEGKSPEQE